MDRDVLLEIRGLLVSHRVLSLAALVEGRAEAGLLPYALRPDYRGVFVQASALARHSRGLLPGTEVGVLVHAADMAAGDPLQIPRLSVQATVTVLDRDGEAFAAASERFVARFPAAAVTLELGDFNFYELMFGRGRFVAGFARAFNVGAHTFDELSRLEAES
jgi:putative heme iron utilization protein